MINFQKPPKKEPKKDLPSSSKASTSKRKSKDANEDVKKKKPKKKKDPNAPKRALSGFMFFSQMEREVRFMFYIPVVWFWIWVYGNDHFLSVKLSITIDRRYFNHYLVFLLTEFKENQSWDFIYWCGKSTWREMEKDVRYGWLAVDAFHAVPFPCNVIPDH